MKYFYLAIQCQDVNKKCWAYVQRVHDCCNIVNIISGNDDIVSVNIAPSKCDATRWVENWNDGYIKNNVFALS